MTASSNVEIVSLALAVDSSQVDKAADSLDKLATSGTAAETATQKLATSSKASSAGLSAFSAIDFGSRWRSAHENISAAAAALDATGKSGKNAADGLKLTGQQAQILAVQVKDFFESIISGQNPIRAFAQQAGTSVSIVGGFSNAVRLLGGLINPLTIGITAGTAALGALAVAAYEGWKQTEALNKSLQLTGNFAGIAASSYGDMVSALATSTKTTVGQARDALDAVIATGLFGQKSVSSVAAAVATFSKVSGQSTDEVIKQFSQMAGGVANWAAAANRAYHFLTGAQYTYIKQLEAQGKQDEASKVAADALNDALLKRAPALGTLERAWKGIAEAASKAWDSMLNAGRPETIDDKIKKATEQLAAAEAALAHPRSTASQESREQRVAAIRENLRDLGDQRAAETLKASADADKAKQDQKDITDKSEANQAALTALTLAGARARSAVTQVTIEKERIALDRSYQANLTSLIDYNAAKYAIESQDVARQQALLDAEIAAEKKRVIRDDQTPEGKNRAARIVDLETQRYQLTLKRLTLEDQFRNRELKPGNVINFFNNDERKRFEHESHKAIDDAAEGALLAHQKSAADAAETLIEQNRVLNAELIKDDRARGLAQIAIEEEVLRKKLELDKDILSPEARKTAEDALAGFRLAKEQQLTEQLKPQWQKQLEAYRDTTRLMKDSFDEFADGMLKSAEDVWVEFAKTGKLNVRSLIDFMIEEFARINFRKLVGESSGEGGVLGGIISAIKGALFTPGNGSDPNGYGGTQNNISAYVAGGRAWGGPVNRGSLYQVNENGPGELLNVGGRQYLMAGSDGSVTPRRNMSSSSGPTIHVRVDGSTDPARLAQLVNDGVTSALGAYDRSLHERGVT